MDEEILIRLREQVDRTDEEIQADIFDHFFAVVPMFELGIYQNPTGKDFSKISETAVK